MEIAAVILAGGKSRRMGRDKLELSIGGETLLESSVKRFSEAFRDVFISVADAGKYPEITAQRIVDVLPGAGPLSGLHASLSAVAADGVFLVAADLPFASALLAKRIIGLTGDKEAGVIRLHDGKLEPLFALYRTSLLSRCEAAIVSGDNRMTGVIFSADTRYIDTGELGDLWDEKAIVNINSPEDYRKYLL